MEKYRSLHRSSTDDTEKRNHESAPLAPSSSSSDDGEETFYKHPQKTSRRLWSLKILHVFTLYSIILVLSIYLFISTPWRKQKWVDPSIGLYSPAQDAISYKPVEFEKHFTNRSPYTQTPSKELDDKWEELYNFGLSGITPEEASHLHEPTAHLPHDNSTYVVTLGVFHQLHCVNHLRHALYPDEYPGLWEWNEDGTVKRDSNWALHWDHCIDILRQTLMCHGDVTPMPFFYREVDDNVYSVLASTETCRDFERIKGWALERQITHWRWNESTTQQNIG